MNKAKILSIVLCSVVISTSVIPAMAVSNISDVKAKEVSTDYINPISSQ